jgi:hypothetical protein
MGSGTIGWDLISYENPMALEKKIIEINKLSPQTTV